MKIFISWSGERSKAVAFALKEWLVDVLLIPEVFMSQLDLDAGTRWSQRISNELETSNFGIICLTPENMNSKWILFEAGALSKFNDSSRLIPYVIDMPFSEVEPPLSQFQSVLANKEGTFKMLGSINASSEQILPTDRLVRIFETWWPSLDEKLQLAIRIKTTERKPTVRSERSILEEILNLLRAPKQKVSVLNSGAYTILIIQSNDFPIGQPWEDRVRISTDQSIKSFVDKVYSLLNEHQDIEEWTYGVEWVLRNKKSGVIYSDIGRRYCKENNSDKNKMPFTSLGLHDGDVLVIEKCESQ